MPPAARPNEGNWNLAWAESFSRFTDSLHSVSYGPAAGQNETSEDRETRSSLGPPKLDSGPAWRQLVAKGC